MTVLGDVIATTADSSRRGRALREPRWLHPMAWWSWALGLAVAASVTTNPLLLLGIITVVALVVDRRQPDAPWSRSFGFLVRIAVLVVAIRVLAQILFGAPTGTISVLPLPGLTLPTWLAGVRIGGDIMLEPLLQAIYDGLRLAAIIVTIGAAASLASPSRVLKSIPAALYEIGVSVVVASTFVPQLASDLTRVRANRRLRGRAESGLRGVGGAMMPVLHGAVDRSITLAAAMDSRGYGRMNARSQRERYVTTTAMLAGLLLVVVGLFLLLGTTGSRSAVGFVAVLTGIALGAVGVAAASRRSPRTRYRPNAWHAADVWTAVFGFVAAACFVMGGIFDPTAMATATSPPVWPTISLLPVVGLVVASLPAVITPHPPSAIASSEVPR